MKRAITIVKIHPCHIREIEIWVAEWMAAQGRHQEHRLSRYVDGALARAYEVDDLRYSTLHALAPELSVDDAKFVATSVGRALREAGMDLCSRYDPIAHKIVLIGREKVRDVCGWFSRGRAPAMA